LVTDAYDYNKNRFVDANDQLIARNNPTNLATQLIKINIGTAGPFAPEGDGGDAGIASALAGTSSDVDSASIYTVPSFATIETSIVALPSAQESKWNGRLTALAVAAAWHSFGDELRGRDGADELFELDAADDLLAALTSVRWVASVRRR
jgi:hypothetical protein